ncbi:glutamate--tRNA ligase [Cohnella sp. CFH 77786]|uniref:glutamate--tRNA ligase n=1 Tax=Cohnella sp. CFH 77786 TaxID=2662265 RepID=UPI001C60BE82|nr:glutamate--tRNA ligase [Cohnella sp. CFH 77786]MBW5449199.1 glutamate--tRNA ligase [Cohnella sp. CFH 77786]
MNTSVRVRYAPSPTGHLHIGGARTALFTYLFARKHGGQFILRIEDTDLDRNVSGAAEEFYNGLRWLGIEWDEGEDVGGPYGPYRCTDRMDIYRELIDRLLREDKAYFCYCTEEELSRERDAQIAAGETAKYSGRCRHLTPEQRAAFEDEGRSRTVRLRTSAGETLAFRDLVRGDISFEADGNDFVIVKSNGMPTYNLAVVIDDHLMKITHVTRGEEHISNTPRQMQIYRAFGWDVPEFAHFNLILNDEGKKLSKRDESILQFISQYRDLGYLEEAILNFLALLGWSPGTEEEIFSKPELIELFSFDRVNKSGSIFDQRKLAWMNNHYFKKAEPERIVRLCAPQLQKAGRLPESLDEAQTAWMNVLVSLHQEKMNCAADIVPLSDLFFADAVVVENDEARAVLAEETVPAVLSAFARQIEAAGSEGFTVDGIKAAIKAVQAETGVKGKGLFMPIRVALTGQMHGPDLNGTVWLLGRDRVLRRLAEAAGGRQ